MDYKQIVKEVLSQIVDGVRDSGQTTGKSTTVHFDFLDEPRVQFEIDLVFPIESGYSESHP